MNQYIWQKKNWPRFTWNSEELIELLGTARKAQGRLLAQLRLIGIEDQADILIEETVTTSAIEGENLDREAIRSSVARRLGLSNAGLSPKQRHIDGLVAMLIDASSAYDVPLTAKRLFGWHAALFPTGFSGIHKIRVGQWRSGDEPMRVVSGAAGREKIHFEAPPSKAVSDEMNALLLWWKSSPAQLDGLLRAAIAHLWFVTIHPFDDGNGRIARAITDMALSQDEKTGRRLYSLSAQIVRDRNDYYTILEKTQKSGCDITEWLKWFLGMYTRAISLSEGVVEKAFSVAQFWRKHSRAELNERQLKVIQKLLEAEPRGFEGGLTNRKYVSMTRTSRETAKRDLSDLESKGLLRRNSGKGRSVSYSLIV